MHVNQEDKLDVTGHFVEVIADAQLCEATLISIQNYYTFCNFNTLEDAQIFLAKMHALGKEDACGVNTDRPHVKFEVAIHHPR